MCTRFFGSKQGNFVQLYHTQVMTLTDSRANNFETMWSSTLFLHILRFARSYRIGIVTISKFQFFLTFWNFQNIKISKNVLTPICAGGSIKEWVCSVSRGKDGDTRIWVPGLTFSSLTRAPLGGYFEPPPPLRYLLNQCRYQHQTCSTLSPNIFTHCVKILKSRVS